jgi:hypothetical protein
MSSAVRRQKAGLKVPHSEGWSAAGPGWFFRWAPIVIISAFFASHTGIHHIPATGRAADHFTIVVTPLIRLTPLLL